MPSTVQMQNEYTTPHARTCPWLLILHIQSHVWSTQLKAIPIQYWNKCLSLYCDDGGKKSFWNLSALPPDYTVSHPEDSNIPLCKVWWRVEVTKFLIMRFSPVSCHFACLRTKCFPPASCSQTLSTYGVQYFTNLCSHFTFTFTYYFNKTKM